MSHIYVVASGFGLRVIPATAPYTLSRGPNENEVDVELGTNLFARIVADRKGGYTSKLAKNTKSLSEVVDVVSGPEGKTWMVEAGPYKAPLPIGWTLHASGALDSGTPFDFVSPRGAMVFIQTPREKPSVEQLAVAGQTLSASGESKSEFWVEVDYDVDGQPWFQRHHVMPIGEFHCVVTLQSPQQDVETARAGFQTVVDGLEASELS